MSTQKELARKYFDFRLSQESILDSIKNEHKRRKKILLNNLKKHSNISIQRIDKAISASKYLDVKNNNTLFDFITSDLKGKCLENYVLAKEDINDYIENVYEMQSEIAAARKQKKREFNKFKKTVSIDLTMLNHYYLQFKADLITYRKVGELSRSFDKIVETNAFIAEVKEEYFRKEINKMDECKVALRRERKLKEEQERIQLEAACEIIGVIPEHKTDDYKLVTEVLSEMGIDV